MCSKIITIAFVFLTLAVFGYAKNLTYKDCGSVSGTINSLDVSPCESDPCVMKGGNNYTVNIGFTSKVNSTSAKTVVHGIIHDVPVPFPVPSDCCNDHNLKCPLVAGATDTYTNFVFCSPAYPKIRLIVKWEVQDDNSKDIICFEVPLEIQ